MTDAATDADLLAEVPEYVRLGTMMKAAPSEEGGRRVLYFEASNEDVDHQNEVVLQKALAESADYYVAHGNLDLSHLSILGARQGIPNYQEYEIGRPLAVRVDGARTFVKAELYTGDSAMARNASMVWDSLTKQKPAARWFASVAGAVLAKSVRIDPASGNRVAVVEKVRWNSTALDRCPVNKTVPEVSTSPVGMFAKALGGFVLKAIEAGYGTDSATLEGGGALREQSLDRGVQSYWDLRDKLAGDIRKRRTKGGAADLVERAHQTYGLSKALAAEWVERFHADLAADLAARSLTSPQRTAPCQ